MSFLQIPNGIPGFTKAVISFWFRVPQASIDKNVSESPPFLFPDDPRNVLWGTIPLVTIGELPTSPRYEGITRNVARSPGTIPYPNPIYDSPDFHKVADDPISPSYIGLDCFGGEKNYAQLSFNLQMAGRASIAAVAYNRTSVDVWSDAEPGGPFETHAEVFSTPGSGWEASSGWGFFTSLVDNSRYWSMQRERFLVTSSVVIAPDVWHHLLLSFDISTACITHGAPPNLSHMGASSSNASTAAGTDSYCRMWYAIDDVNYDRSTFDLGPYDVTGSADMNAILTANAHDVANKRTYLPYNCIPGTPSYSFSAEALPTAQFGIPASQQFVANVLHLEMAEFQMFTGVTVDTSKPANRRAFVDADGYPVQPTGQPAPAEKLLGKRPAVLLHGSSNWTGGKNTGSLGIAANGDLIPSGQFVKTGRVPSYKPDPSLHGPQSPALRAAPVRLTRSANARL